MAFRQSATVAARALLGRRPAPSLTSIRQYSQNSAPAPSDEPTYVTVKISKELTRLAACVCLGYFIAECRGEGTKEDGSEQDRVMSM